MADRPAARVAVVGAGTMGSGIAQLAARAGADTLLYDPFPEAQETGLARARDGLERETRRGKLSAQDAAAAAARLAGAADLEALGQCDLVVEAIPERLELKHELFGALSSIVGESCVLATNTSSLPVTAVAAGADRPERVVGMHFFNPAPVMELVEVIAGVLSGPAALAVVEETGRAMGKTVIRAADGPGFLVNRCNRPFGLEGLKLLAERVADAHTIDRVCRMAAGFPMGPFELMDLVGVDTGLAVAESFYELSFGEPRWRPSPIAARQAAAGLLGRKSGRGYYKYKKDADGKLRYRDADEGEPEAAERNVEGDVVVAGETPLARELAQAARAAGYDGSRAGRTRHPACCPRSRSTAGPCRTRRARRRRTLVLCASAPLALLDRGGAVGFHALPPFDDGAPRRADTARGLISARGGARRALLRLARPTGRVGRRRSRPRRRAHRLPVDQRGGVRPRGRGRQRRRHRRRHAPRARSPRGPIEWAHAIGLEHVLAVLDGLWSLQRDERYRAAPALRVAAEAGLPLHD